MPTHYIFLYTTHTNTINTEMY